MENVAIISDSIFVIYNYIRYSWEVSHRDTLVSSIIKLLWYWSLDWIWKVIDVHVSDNLGTP